jgi:hypothetical protein
MNLKLDPPFGGKNYMERHWRRVSCEECLDKRRNKLVAHSAYQTKRGNSAIRSTAGIIVVQSSRLLWSDYLFGMQEDKECRLMLG